MGGDTAWGCSDFVDSCVGTEFLGGRRIWVGIDAAANDDDDEGVVLLLGSLFSLLLPTRLSGGREVDLFPGSGRKPNGDTSIQITISSPFWNLCSIRWTSSQVLSSLAFSNRCWLLTKGRDFVGEALLLTNAPWNKAVATIRGSIRLLSQGFRPSKAMVVAVVVVVVVVVVRTTTLRSS